MQFLVIPAVLCLLMGFAMQRGSVCALAAVFEMLHARRSERMSSLAEAVLWSLAILGTAEIAGVAVPWPSITSATLLTVLGGVLLGVGAVINRACVMGTVARIGSGETAYLWTPVGFFLACFLVRWTDLVPQLDVRVAGPSDLRSVASILAVVGLIGLIVRRRSRVTLTPSPAAERSGDSGQPGESEAPGSGGTGASTALTVRRRVVRSPELTLVEVVRRPFWSPRPATIVIALASVGLVLTGTDGTLSRALQTFATGAHLSGTSTWLWVVGLVGPLAGSIAAGLLAGRLRFRAPSVKVQVACLVGGALMGLGGMLVLGGNDQLILRGMPMLGGAAWLATASMFVTMAGAVALNLRLASR